MRLTRTLLLCLGVGTLFWSATAKAETSAPISMTVWDNRTGDNRFNSSPPIPPTTPVYTEGSVTQLVGTFDSNPIPGIYDDFIIRYQGTITSPVTKDVRFYIPGDDGIRFILDGQTIIDDWYDKGGGGTMSAAISLEAGVPHQFELWFYENGGGAWFTAYWDIYGWWQMIGDTSFGVTTTTSTTTTTSSTTTTTTQPEPTTTPEPTPTTEESTSTTNVVVPYVSTTVPAATTTTEHQTTTTSTTSTTVAPDTLPPDTTVPLAEEKGGTTPPEASFNIPPLKRVYKSRVHFGPISFTITITGAQKRTVTAVAVVQIATLGGLQATQTTSRRRT